MKQSRKADLSSAQLRDRVKDPALSEASADTTGACQSILPDMSCWYNTKHGPSIMGERNAKTTLITTVLLELFG